MYTITFLFNIVLEVLASKKKKWKVNPQKFQMSVVDTGELKRYTHANIHSTAIYNSQDTIIQVPINKWLKIHTQTHKMEYYYYVAIKRMKYCHLQ